MLVQMENVIGIKFFVCTNCFLSAFFPEKNNTALNVRKFFDADILNLTSFPFSIFHSMTS